MHYLSRSTINHFVASLCPLASGPDNAAGPQYPQMLRNRRLREPQIPLDLCNVTFILKQARSDCKTRRMSKRFQYLTGIFTVHALLEDPYQVLLEPVADGRRGPTLRLPVGKTRTRNPSAYSPLIYCSWSNRIHSFGGSSSKVGRIIHTPASPVKSEMLAHHPQCWFFVQVDHHQLDQLSLPLCVNMIETEGCQKRISVRTYAMHGLRSREGFSKHRGREREGSRVKKGSPRNSRLRRAVP